MSLGPKSLARECAPTLIYLKLLIYCSVIFYSLKGYNLRYTVCVKMNCQVKNNTIFESNEDEILMGSQKPHVSESRQVSNVQPQHGMARYGHCIFLFFFQESFRLEIMVWGMTFKYFLLKAEVELWREEESMSAETTTECTFAAKSNPEAQPPGILTSFFRKALSWPLKVTRDLLDLPRRLSNWMHGFLHCTSLHFRDNAYNYIYLYELLSFSVPFLCALQELLAHIYRDVELSCENVLELVKKLFRIWKKKILKLCCAFQISKTSSLLTVLAHFIQWVFLNEPRVPFVKYDNNLQIISDFWLYHEGQCPDTFLNYGDNMKD